MALMNKQIDFAKSSVPFEIISATFIESLEQFIFVEAFKIDAVREAITGLNFCYQKIDILPLDEMTKIYEDQQSRLVPPEKKQWVRIKNGLYQDDLGVVYDSSRNDRIIVKLIPRLDPGLMGSRKSQVANRGKRQFQRFDQCNFDPELYKNAEKSKVNWSRSTFYKLKSFYFRKGFIYKFFTLKELESQNVKPTQEEREMFLQIYNKFTQGDGDSSSDAPDNTRMLIMNDSGQDLKIGDKIIVKGGELNGAVGKIINFDDRGDQVKFQPTNIEGFNEFLEIEKAAVLKYFEQKDFVRIVFGKYQGETGTVMKVDDDQPSQPYVMLDSSKREIQVQTNQL